MASGKWDKTTTTIMRVVKSERTKKTAKFAGWGMFAALLVGGVLFCGLLAAGLYYRHLLLSLFDFIFHVGR